MRELIFTFFYFYFKKMNIISNNFKLSMLESKGDKKMEENSEKEFELREEEPSQLDEESLSEFIIDLLL